MSSVNRRHEVGPGENRAAKAVSNNRKKKKTTVGVVFTDLYERATAENGGKSRRRYLLSQSDTRSENLDFERALYIQKFVYL